MHVLYNLLFTFYRICPYNICNKMLTDHSLGAPMRWKADLVHNTRVTMTEVSRPLFPILDKGRWLGD